MDIKLNDDQLEIARQARRFCENETPPEFVFEMFEDEQGLTDEVWNKMVEMGWTAMRIPEEYDGLGMDFMDLAVVLMEMGRAVAPGPFFSTVVLAAEIIGFAGSEEQKKKYLPAIALGELKASLALYEQDGGGDYGYIQMEARPDGENHVLLGNKVMVPDAHLADVLIVAARTKNGDSPEDGLTLFLVDPKSEDIDITSVPTMDGTRKAAMVDFHGVSVGPEAVLGRVDQGWTPLNQALCRAQVGLAAECVGGAEKVLETAVEYAKARVQFDQPIGSYQAIKHMCAQMYAEMESARSLIYWAAWAQDYGDPGEDEIAASTAKAYCSEIYRNAASTATQILGGIGFTWEHDMHLYLKRSKANQVNLGDASFHREKIVRLVSGN